MNDINDNSDSPGGKEEIPAETPPGAPDVEIGERIEAAPGSLVKVLYGKMRRLGHFRMPVDFEITSGQVVVTTHRGTELGTALGQEDSSRLEQTGDILRLANTRDMETAKLIAERDEPHEMDIFKVKAAAHRLKLKPIAVEHLLGSERIIFYFTSDDRVDFRALVRDLVHECRTRIELQRIGVRDAARLLGDCGICGEKLCCKRFLDELEHVSIKMARVQMTTLDPMKISGCCGKLLCCLRYEYDGYIKSMKEMPKRGRNVSTPMGKGRVKKANPLTQQVTVSLDDGNEATVELEDIGKPPAPRAKILEKSDSAMSSRETQRMIEKQNDRKGDNSKSSGKGSGKKRSRGRRRRRGRRSRNRRKGNSGKSSGNK